MRTTNSSTLSLLSLLSLSAVLTGAAAGCDAVEEDLGEVTLRPWGCHWCTITGGNTATINDARLPHWYLDRTFGDGYSIGLGEASNKGLFKLDVDPLTDRFIGRALSYGPTPGPIILSGSGMLGATFDVVAGDTASVTLEITEYDDTVLSWSDSGGQITAYKATYFDTQGVQRALCPSTDPDNQWFTLIANERYSGVNEVVAADRSVTIACVGEAVAKMKLMDFHPNGNRQASAAERQATLRMITADYCGTGHSFTVNGTQVAWRDAAGLIEPTVGEKVLEALWDADGAICLNKPRHVSITDVEDVCGSIPLCDSGDFVEGVVWRTMLPK